MKLKRDFKINMEMIRFPLSESTVQPEIAKQLARQAVYAIILGFNRNYYLCIIRFEYRFALAAVVALVHDALLTYCFFLYI